MRQIMTKAAAFTLAGTLLITTLMPATAQVARPLAAQVETSADDLVTPVRWRGRGAGIGAGIVAGALLGAGIAASRPYYYGPGPYYYGPGYYEPAPVYVRPPVVYGAPVYDDAVAYCMRRYKSYDPGSGTFLGYDGYRHPCP